MKNKVIILIMLIPIVLMVCVFSAANFTALQVPIAVSSVSLYHENLEVINLVENNTFQINAQVSPINASNKGLIYTYEAVNGKQTPSLNIDNKGLITASGYGTAKVIVTTKDGAYKKSFMLVVTSTKATELVANLSKTDDIVVGDEFSILTAVLPNEALDKLVTFSSSDSNKVRIDALTGEAKALSRGRVTLKATLQNGINGRIEKSFDVVVLPNDSSNPITFDGSQTLFDNIFGTSFSTPMVVDFTDLYSIGFELKTEDIVLDYNNQEANVDLQLTSNEDGVYVYNLNITNINVKEFNLKTSLNYENYSGEISTIKLNKIVDLNDLTVKVTNFKKHIKQNSPEHFTIDIAPKDFTGYTVNAYFKDSKIALAKTGNTYYYQGTTECVDTLIVEISYDGEVLEEKTINETVEVLNPPIELDFVIDPTDYGIEELPTFGNQILLEGKYKEKYTTFDFDDYIDPFTQKTTQINLDDITFESSDESIAKFNENGELEILSEGRVTIKAIERKSKLLGSPLTCEMEIRCVIGVEVGTYEDLVKATNVETDQDLLKATEIGKQIVLTNDIMLGKELVKVNNDGSKTQLYSDAECANILKNEVKQMSTSWEWNYYKYAKGYTEPPKINYIIKFTNNVYGNGYELNANNITNLVDGSGALYPFAVYRGPLTLVELPEAKVMAQDNICFVATDNVMLNNVELIGSNLGGASTADLSALDYVGTVLEVMGDNVKIVNSKIKNGRTCVRVYGKESGNFDKINVLIESCEISYGREFLIKMGTNKKLPGNFEDRAKYDLSKDTLPESVWQACSPLIENYRHLNDGTLTQQQYNAMVEEYKNDQNFQNLVNTNLTVKNSVLHTSGLFSIGLESSFAGPALDGAKYSDNYNFYNLGWREIAGTSYPTQLNLEGDVKIYDWKKLSNIDSSKLIEGSLMNFNLAEMLKNMYEDGDFTEIITTDGTNEYAHGGIVMYGGGKNYCLINNNMTDKNDYLNFTINLDTLKVSSSNPLEAQLMKLLKFASGREDFRFIMCGKNSNLNYYQQDLDLKSGEANKYIGKYVF